MPSFFDPNNIELDSSGKFSLTPSVDTDSLTSEGEFAYSIAANSFLLGIPIRPGEISEGAQVNSQYMQSSSIPISGSGWVAAAGNAVITAGKEALKAAGINVKGFTLYGQMAIKVANSFNVDPALFLGLIQQESSFNPESTSKVGAYGLCQLMPETAHGLGVDPYIIEQNLRGGAKYLRQSLDFYKGDIRLTLASYNAGKGAVRKYGGVPPFRETQDYIVKVLKYAKAFGYKG